MFFILLLSESNLLFCQISSSGIPPGIQNNIDNELYPVVRVSVPDLEKIRAEDAFDDKHALPMRFAVSQPARINVLKEGKWMNLKDGLRICRLAVEAPGALAMILYYSDFSIPDGAELFIYSADKKQVAGAFTNLNNPDGGAFASEMIKGDHLIIEFSQPWNTNKEARLMIDEVGYVYRTAEYIFGQRGFGGSDTCEVNVNCPEGINWQNQKNGVARIIVKQGFSSYWCTGTLLNNTRQDNTPYFLTADHCGPNSTPSEMQQWIFYFRYEAPGCDNVANDTAFNFYTMVGAQKKASSGGAGVDSDFKLMLLNQAVPVDYQPFYNGWDVSNDVSNTGVTIHHPEGDVKKISTYTTPLISTNWGNTPNTHWEVVWSATATNHGVTEAGSSGSPIFDSQGRVIGQLTGGEASCSNLTGPDYYGKLWYAWDKNTSADSTMLKPWLDPDDTGVERLNGIVGVEETAFTGNRISIYPNPVKDRLFVELNHPELHISSVGLYDLLGNLVLQKVLSPSLTSPAAIDMKELNSGIYVLRISAGKKVFTRKVIR